MVFIETKVYTCRKCHSKGILNKITHYSDLIMNNRAYEGSIRIHRIY